MNQTFKISLIRYLLLLSFFALTGCSAIDSYRAPPQTSASSLPKIPEIKRQSSQPPKPRYVQPKKVIEPAPVVIVKPYPKTITSTKPVPQLTQQQKLERQKLVQQQAKKKATVDIDPYASIPENSSNKPSLVTPKNNKPKVNSSSPAVNTLMTSARADIAFGKSRSAISKLERGLRIEPGNAQLWHMLAKAHYSNSAFLHAISIAKKSNANTNDKDLINQNWKLIKLAGERSGNASAIKEALDYMKVNP